jgi:hypothetical protein
MSQKPSFEALDFEKFRILASDPALSMYEKIGFPDSYRAGKEANIVADICDKLRLLTRPNQVVLDVGPGCTDVPHLLIEICRQMEHQLILIDSDEMLQQLPDEPFIRKIAAYYPDQCAAVFEDYTERIDALLSYSVMHYVFEEGNLYRFVDKSLSLLAPDGHMLLGDIPNVSQRKRFFSSVNGIAFHKAFMQTEETPQVEHLRIESGNIDDAVMLGMMMRCRAAGFHAYILPQPPDLPMANRREDFLVMRP